MPKDAIDPRRQEELFETRHVLEAVAKIGGDGSQAFYRRGGPACFNLGAKHKKPQYERDGDVVVASPH